MTDAPRVPDGCVEHPLDVRALDGGTEIISIRYPFVPASIDKATRGKVHCQGDALEVEFNTAEGQHERFRGPISDARANELVLVRSEGGFSLHRLSKTARHTKHIRTETVSAARSTPDRSSSQRDAASDAASPTPHTPDLSHHAPFRHDAASPAVIPPPNATSCAPEISHDTAAREDEDDDALFDISSGEEGEARESNVSMAHADKEDSLQDPAFDDVFDDLLP